MYISAKAVILFFQIKKRKNLKKTEKKNLLLKICIE